MGNSNCRPWGEVIVAQQNRALFADRIAQALARGRRYGGLVAILFLDLDGFKKVNDTMEHAAGDALLKSVANRLSRAVRPTDTASRLAGDEFTVILTDLRHVAAAEVVGKRILEALAAAHEILGQEVTVSASVGISIAPNDGDDAETLLRNADAAMYVAKRAGKNRFAVHAARLTAPPEPLRNSTASGV